MVFDWVTFFSINTFTFMLTFVQTQFRGYSRNRATCQDHEAQTLNTLCNAKAHMKKSLKKSLHNMLFLYR